MKCKKLILEHKKDKNKNIYCGNKGKSGVLYTCGECKYSIKFKKQNDN